MGKESVFYDILQRKKAFLGYKNKKFKQSKNWDFSSFLGYKNDKFKKSKNWDFSKAVNPWFWSKIGHFSTFF